MTIDLHTLTITEKQNWLQHAIAPRPICLASTISKEGNVNLSPFSFFNLFSSNPPVVIFSSSRRVRDNTTKHSLENVLEVPEVVIHICDYEMVQQISLSSCDYSKGIDEFIKAGFTKETATLVKPPMVKEAKVKLECKIIEVKSLGEQGGAGQLIFAEILIMHVDDGILNDENTMIHHPRFQQIARMGGDWYSKVTPDNLFKVPKPNTQLGIGVDNLPESIRNSRTLTGNNLGQLANVHEQPVINASFEDDKLKQIFQYYSLNPTEMEKELHLYAKELLEQGKVQEAWQVLLAN